MAVPGLKKSYHMGFTVPDIQQAIDFFYTHFDFELVEDFGPLVFDDDWMKVHLNVDARAVINRIALMSDGGTKLEFFEYGDTVKRNIQAPNNADVGGHHIAFYVNDMVAAVSYLKANGITVLGEPSPGPTPGDSWVYFLSPWGMQLELVSELGVNAGGQGNKVKVATPR